MHINEITKKGGEWTSGIFSPKRTVWVCRVHKTTFLRNPLTISAFPVNFCNPAIRNIDHCGSQEEEIFPSLSLC